MSRVFISYGSQDRSLAESLATGLQALSCDVWWDRTIAPGQRWDREIERELKTATCVVVLWTDSSRESEWVSNEAAVALRRNTLFPVLVDNAEPPLEFLKRQAVRIETTPEPRFREALARLLQLIAETSQRRLSVVADTPNAEDWRYTGGFETSDPLLKLLPTARPDGKTRYEVCRHYLEQASAPPFDFKAKAKETFELFTSDGASAGLPDQRDATTALLLAHQITEEYAKFGKQIRSDPAAKSKDEKIPVPRCFNRVYLNTVNTFIKDIFSLIKDQNAARRLGLSAQEQDIAAASRHIIKFTRIEPRRSGEKAFAGPEIHATLCTRSPTPESPLHGCAGDVGKV